MRVKLRCRIPGHLLNEVVDLPDSHAQLLISQRQAVRMKDHPIRVDLTRKPVDERDEQE